MASLTAAFAALAIEQGIKPGTKRYRRERDKFIIGEFEEYFGEETKLLNWQKLCTDVGIEGPPASITQCRKALNRVWVNICDLLEAVREGKRVRIFGSRKALVNYTMKNEKFYPRAHAKMCGPVRALLRHIN